MWVENYCGLMFFRDVLKVIVEALEESEMDQDIKPSSKNLEPFEICNYGEIGCNLFMNSAVFSSISVMCYISYPH